MKEEILNTNDFYKSSDLALCASLCVLGYTIEAIDVNESQKASFLFKRDENLDEVIKQYWTHQLRIEPMAFFNSIKEVKSRIYNT